MAGEPTKPGGVHLVGFSIGALAATKIAAFDPEQVSKLTLISPAAPLQLGTFLEDMAGKPIFEMAIKRPGVLALVTRVQDKSPSFLPRS
jgi:pimeloyl-ACP methyl ester carboxylesterase